MRSINGKPMDSTGVAVLLLQNGRTLLPAQHKAHAPSASSSAGRLASEVRERLDGAVRACVL